MGTRSTKNFILLFRNTTSDHGHNTAYICRYRRRDKYGVPRMANGERRLSHENHKVLGVSKGEKSVSVSYFWGVVFGGTYCCGVV